jgi:hypothetical protein
MPVVWSGIWRTQWLGRWQGNDWICRSDKYSPVVHRPHHILILNTQATSDKQITCPSRSSRLYEHSALVYTNTKNIIEEHHHYKHNAFCNTSPQNVPLYLTPAHWGSPLLTQSCERKAISTTIPGHVRKSCEINCLVSPITSIHPSHSPTSFPTDLRSKHIANARQISPWLLHLAWLAPVPSVHVQRAHVKLPRWGWERSRCAEKNSGGLDLAEVRELVQNIRWDD